MSYHHIVSATAKLVQSKVLHIDSATGTEGLAQIEVKHLEADGSGKSYQMNLFIDYVADFTSGDIDIKTIDIKTAKLKYENERLEDDIDYNFGVNDFALVSTALKSALRVCIKTHNIETVLNEETDSAGKEGMIATKDKSKGRIYIEENLFRFHLNVSRTNASGNLRLFIDDERGAVNVGVRFTANLDTKIEKAVFENSLLVKQKVAQIVDIDFTNFFITKPFWSSK